MFEIIQSTDLRRRVRDVLDRVRNKHEPVIVQSYNTPQAVIIPYDDFEAYNEWQSSRAALQARLAELHASTEDAGASATDFEDDTNDLPQLLREGISSGYAAEYQKAISIKMNESVIPAVIEQMLNLPGNAQRKVLEFLHTLRAPAQRGTPGKQLLQYAGLVQPDALAQMQQAIESGCEQVDADEW